MNETLKPCPFCNGKPKLLVTKDPYVTSYINYEFFVCCDNCYSEGGEEEVAQGSDIREAINKAIETWNQRVNDDEKT